MRNLSSTTAALLTSMNLGSPVASGGFSPTSLPGELVLHLDVATPGNMFTTAGGETLSTDGANINRWEAEADSTVTSIDTLQPDPDRNPMTARSEGGYLVAEAIGSNKTLGAALVKNWAEQTHYCLFRMTSVADVWHWHMNGTANAHAAIRSQTAQTMRAVSYATVQTFGVSPVMDLRWHIFAFTYSDAAGISRAWVDGAEVTSTIGGVATAASIDSTILNFGSVSGSTCNARFAALAVYDAAHTPTQVRAMTDYWRSRYASLVPAASESVLIFTGASNLMDANAGNGLSVSARLLAGNAHGCTLGYNFAKPSTHTLQSTARIAEEAGVILARHASAKVVVLHYAGGNDAVVGGYTAQQMYDRVCELGDALRAIKPDVGFAAATYLPRTSFNDVVRGDANALFMANATGKIDEVIPWHTNGNIGGDGDNANTVYFLGDGIHMIAAGTLEAYSGDGGARDPIDSLLAS